MQIYNTLTKRKEEFIPLNPPNVSIYVCGPTVYDYFHIGNARSFIMADVIRRYLEYRSYNVKFVMNLTDIDDKIINKSIKNKISAQEVAETFASAFFEDIQKLKVKRATVYPKATEHIGDIIELIKQLKKRGFAYNIKGNVFYDVARFSSYGKLSGKKIDDLEVGARIEVNEEKKNPLDFALWKKAKEGEPYWDSPWGKGRPGWHIECSAMSSKHLGETIDIHAGGNDLIFPHHENEIAQSEACSQKDFVKYWIHFGFLNINYQKMSKSLGNFFTAREVLKKFSPEAVRFFFCQTHYAGPLNYSDELLTSAQKGLEKLGNLTYKIREELNNNVADGILPELDLKLYERGFEEAMDDDFNTPQALAVIFDLVKEANRIIASHERINKEFYQRLKDFLEKTAEGVLGIMDNKEASEGAETVLNQELIQLLIKLRMSAKANKNFQLSDEIRDELKKLGVILQDQKDKTIYKIVNI